MYYGSIKPCDIANGTGVRVTLFVSGCTHRCKGCFQPQTWDFRYGQPFAAETEEALLEALDRPWWTCWWMGNLWRLSGTSPCAFAAPPTSGCWTSPPPWPPGGPSLGKAKQQKTGRPERDPSLRPACFFSTASYIPPP